MAAAGHGAFTTPTKTAQQLRDTSNTLNQQSIARLVAIQKRQIEAERILGEGDVGCFDYKHVAIIKPLHEHTLIGLVPHHEDDAQHTSST